MVVVFHNSVYGSSVDSINLLVNINIACCLHYVVQHAAKLFFLLYLGGGKGSGILYIVFLFYRLPDFGN